MKSAEKFGIPVVTLIDTPGAYPGLRGRGARTRRGYCAEHFRNAVNLKVPVISVIIGEGASGGALGIRSR